MDDSTYWEESAYCGKCREIQPHWASDLLGTMVCGLCGTEQDLDLYGWDEQEPVIQDGEFDLWEVFDGATR